MIRTILAALLLAGCTTTSTAGRSPVTMAVTTPGFWVETDGIVGVAWSEGQADLQLYGRLTGLPLYGVLTQTGKVLCWQIGGEPSHIYAWPGDALPAWAAPAFAAGRAEARGVTFEPE